MEYSTSKDMQGKRRITERHFPLRALQNTNLLDCLWVGVHSAENPFDL